MPLTKQDLSQIKGVVHGIVQKEVDNLACIVAKGFEDVDRRFQEVDKRFEQVDQRFEQVDKKFEQVDKRFEEVEHQLHGLWSEVGIIRRDTSYVKENMIDGEKFEDLLSRVELLEEKASIKA